LSLSRSRLALFQAGEEKVWSIPLIAGGSNVAAAASSGYSLMTTKDFELRIPTQQASTATDWVKLNFGQAVPARVLYTPDMLQRLSAAVK
jgi:hypothetical protein